ncbi:Lsr2 dimerization domain-containing protein [Lentzea flava]|uniref:Lsr2 dimerization domain-containing protein n=1 Tax=Lentzea flava TaxID=103732 RepID=A0ABQ2UN56_9PSEU|nr:histone-like nucleoid-structuring protein Lsr2 [Lentzea flava]MCP2200040.1 Lsr2 protein [Lentzea flava]GGU45739.1 hypothetical protein GCM10010178_42740 [Lentzea flava]
MATVTQTYYADDTDPTIEAHYRVRIVVNGIEWELDLSRDNHDEFNADMKKWTQHARKVGGQRIEPKPLKGRKFSVEDEDERKQIRAWAVANGKDVSEHGGRLADDYIRQYCQPNRPDKRTTARPDPDVAVVASNPGPVDAMPEPEAHEPEERLIQGLMTQEGWFYESYDDALTVAKRMGRHAIRKDGGGLVVIELGVSYQQSLKEAAAKEKAAPGTQAPVVAAVKTNRNATRAVMRKLFSEVSMWRTAADSMSLDTKEDFVQQAKAWLGDKTNLSHKTLETADWDEVYKYAVSTRQAEASAEVGSRTEPAGAANVQKTAESAGSTPKSGRRTKAAPRTNATDKKPETAGTNAKPAGGRGAAKASPKAASSPSPRRQAAA